MTLVLNGTNGLSDVDGSAATPAIRGTDANTGIFFPAADTIAFSEGGAEAMRIDSSGNVGIGISPNASSKLQVKAATNSNVAVWDSSGTPMLLGLTDAGASQSLRIAGFPLTFTGNGGGGAEAMRIDSSGNLLVGSTSVVTTNEKFFIDQPTSAYWGQSFKLGNTANGIIFTNTSGTASYTAVSFRNNGATLSSCGAITVSGTATAYGVGTSDYRLKENVENYTGGLSAITALRPVTFTWKQSGDSDVGFIAHEIQAVIPQAVQGKKDAVDTDGNPEYQSIFPAPAQMIANLVGAIQELKALVDTQASTITTLTDRVSALDERLTALEAKP